LRLTSIGYERLLFFLMCNTLPCVRQFFVIHLAIIFLLFTTTTSNYLDDSIGIYYSGFSVKYLNMPVTTQSMMKRGLQPPPGSV
jgi:hypothetical protein